MGEGAGCRGGGDGKPYFMIQWRIQTQQSKRLEIILERKLRVRTRSGGGGLGWGEGQAALLHDTVEDTDTTFREIRDNFGEEVEGKDSEWGRGLGWGEGGGCRQPYFMIQWRIQTQHSKRLEIILKKKSMVRTWSGVWLRGRGGGWQPYFMIQWRIQTKYSKRSEMILERKLSVRTWIGGEGSWVWERGEVGGRGQAAFLHDTVDDTDTTFQEITFKLSVRNM